MPGQGDALEIKPKFYMGADALVVSSDPRSRVSPLKTYDTIEEAVG